MSQPVRSKVLYRVLKPLVSIVSSVGDAVERSLSLGGAAAGVGTSGFTLPVHFVVTFLTLSFSKPPNAHLLSPASKPYHLPWCIAINEIRHLNPVLGSINAEFRVQGHHT